MAGEAGGLTFVLDQNFGARTLDVLKLARLAPVGRITSLTELGFAADAPDEDWSRLSARGGRTPSSPATVKSSARRSASRHGWPRG